MSSLCTKPLFVVEFFEIRTIKKSDALIAFVMADRHLSPGNKHSLSYHGSMLEKDLS
jgi:hypothetical protein